MLEADLVLESLEVARREGADRDGLLRTAVREIERSEDRFDWVGVYLLDPEDGVLELHNYVGRPTEHDRIEVGEGVCGTAVAEDRDINVPDVTEVENYLACSPETQSELVVLIREDGSGRILGQLDLDSDEPDAFDQRDREQLRRVADWLADLFT